MVDEIKAGDVVQLKSGGPHMTVSKLREWQGRTEAHCDWFEGLTAKYGSFPLTSLRIVAEERGAEAGLGGELLGGDPSTRWMR